MRYNNAGDEALWAYLANSTSTGATFTRAAVGNARIGAEVARAWQDMKSMADVDFDVIVPKLLLTALTRYRQGSRLSSLGTVAEMRRVRKAAWDLVLSQDEEALTGDQLDLVTRYGVITDSAATQTWQDAIDGRNVAVASGTIQLYVAAGKQRYVMSPAQVVAARLDYGLCEAFPTGEASAIELAEWISMFAATTATSLPTPACTIDAVNHSAAAANTTLRTPCTESTDPVNPGLPLRAQPGRPRLRVGHEVDAPGDVAGPLL